MSGFAVMRAFNYQDEAEAWGPFRTQEAAEKFCQDFEEYVNPGYSYCVVELFQVRDGQKQIREEKADEERLGR